MAANADELKNFKKKLEKINGQEKDEFLQDCVKELAARLLQKVIKRTPVGIYEKGSGRTGGTLRRGWTAGKKSAGAAFANSLKVHHFDDTYVIEIFNDVEYASYVEFGHRTANHKGWVNGHFMLTISEKEIKDTAKPILEAKLNKWLKDVLK